MSRFVRALKIVVRDERIPRPLRWFAGFAVLPIPGPVDEIALVLVAPVFLVFYRRHMAEAWRVSGRRAI
jgi:hypothetical protein